MVYNQQQSLEVIYRAEELIRQPQTNRYRVTVQVARRAKQFRFGDPDNKDDLFLKPVRWAILDMADELIQPGLIAK